jgi:MSHA biogenesis protein MshQ
MSISIRRLGSILALALCCIASSAHAQIELSVNGDTGPIEIEPGDTLTFTVTASGCPSSNRWRDTLSANGTQIFQDVYPDSPCDASPFQFGPLQFNQEGTYVVSYTSEYCRRTNPGQSFCPPGQVRLFEVARIEVVVGERLVCFQDDFQRSSLGPDWSTSFRSGSFGSPRIVDSGRLRLTDASGNVSTAAILQRRFPFAENRVVVEFDYFAYDGNGSTGADGITLSFSDVDVTPEPGGFGGSLGYAQRSGVDGFAGGWVGIGVDEFGNFSNPTEGREGGPGRRIQTVAVRGSGSGRSGYRYLAGTNSLSPGVAVPSSNSPAPGHRYRIVLDAETPGEALVSVERNTGAGFQTLIAPFNALTDSNQAAPPEALLLTLTGSTGGSRNIHEIGNLEVCANQIQPLTNPIDHFRIDHDGEGLTCAPENVTVTACANADCSQTYNEPTQVTLGPSGWSGGSTQVFSGGSGTFQFRRNTPGQSTLRLLDSEPTASNITRCYQNGVEGDCTLDFSLSGFLFGEASDGYTIDDQLSARSSDPITIRAVKADPADPQSCAPAFNEPKSVGFWFDYSNPTTGTRSLALDAQALGTSSPGTPINLDFDASATAQFTLNYPDAGRLTLNARYEGTGEEAGLVMTGNSAFVVRPDAFCVDSTAANWRCEGVLSECSVLTQAGAEFPLRVRAVQWAAGSPPACDRDSTPNYQGTISLSSNLVAPDPGLPGVLAQTSSVISSDGRVTILDQRYSEVGAITVTARSDGDYLDSAEVSGVSATLGRFTPDRFLLSATAEGQLSATCSAFTYVGQDIEHAVPAEIRVEALNARGVRTRNYAGDWSNASVSPVSSRHADDLEPLAANLSVLASLNANLSPFADGIATLLIDGSLSYTRDDSVPVAPFIGGFSHSLSVTDAAASSVPEPFSIESTLPDDADELRWGRLAIENAYGPEISALPMPLFTSVYDGAGWVLSADDNCTTLSSTDLRLTGTDAVVGTSATATVGAGSSSVSVTSSPAAAGRIDLLFSAPGEGNTGSVLVEPLLDANYPYLQFDWDGDGSMDNPVGQASFGVFSGQDGLIDRRESN